MGWAIFMSRRMPKLATCLSRAMLSAPGATLTRTSGFAAWILGRCAENSAEPSGYGVVPSSVPPCRLSDSWKTMLHCLPHA